MFKSQKRIIYGVVALLIVSLGVLGVTGVSFYKTAESALTPVTRTEATTPQLLPQYGGVFFSIFIGNYFADKGNFDQAFVAAVDATATQALKDGKLTQTQANAIESRYSNGLASLNGGFFSFGYGRTAFSAEQLITTSDIAKALGISESTLSTDLRSGKSIAEIASAQNKDLTALKQTLLADAKSKLDSEVSAKTLTQAEADKLYQSLSTSIDSLLNNTQNFSGRNDGSNSMPGMPGSQNGNNQNQGPRV